MQRIDISAQMCKRLLLETVLLRQQNLLGFNAVCRCHFPQSARRLIDRVKACESHALFVILLIRRALDDTLYPADDLVAVKGEEIHDITAVVVDKAFLEHSLFIAVQRRDKVGTVLV